MKEGRCAILTKAYDSGENHISKKSMRDTAICKPSATSAKTTAKIRSFAVRDAVTRLALLVAGTERGAVDGIVMFTFLLD